MSAPGIQKKAERQNYENLMNEDACDLVDYVRSESTEFSLSPKNG